MDGSCVCYYYRSINVNRIHHQTQNIDFKQNVNGFDFRHETACFNYLIIKSNLIKI